MLWRAYALLSHGTDRVGLRRRTSRAAPGALKRPGDVLDVLERLDEAVWAANAIAALSESGILAHLVTPHSPGEIAQAVGLPTAHVEGLLDVIEGLGFLTREGERVVAAPALVPFTQGGGADAFRAALRSPLLQAEDLRRRARERRLALEGWTFTDPEVIEAQGALTQLWADRAADKLRFLPGLVPRLKNPGAALLDVGAGAAGLSIALCRRFPQLHAVALEPAPAPAGVGERHVREAGLHNRIDVRRQRVEDIADEASFDLAFLPQMFLPDAIIERSVRNVHRALKPGGWMLAAVMARPGGDLAAAVARLKNLLWGGNVRGADALHPILVAAGFDPVIRSPGGGAIRMICARRPPA